MDGAMEAVAVEMDGAASPDLDQAASGAGAGGEIPAAGTPAVESAPTSYEIDGTPATLEEIKTWRQAHQNSNRWTEANTKRAQQIADERRQLTAEREQLLRERTTGKVKEEPAPGFQYEDGELSAFGNALTKHMLEQVQQSISPLLPLGKHFQDWQTEQEHAKTTAWLENFEGQTAELAKSYGIHEDSLRWAASKQPDGDLESLAAQLAQATRQQVLPKEPVRGADSGVPAAPSAGGGTPPAAFRGKGGQVKALDDPGFEQDAVKYLEALRRAANG